MRSTNRLFRLELLLWAGGVALATIYGLGWLERNAFQWWYAAPASVREEIVSELPKDLFPLPPLTTGTILGKIEIPGSGVSAMFVEGVDAKSLARAVGHIPGSALPGQPGRITLAAHRDTFFRGLRNIKLQDRIQLQTETAAWDYQIVATEIVLPNRTDVIAPTTESLLTLVTCYPFDFVGKAPKRFIVHARLVPGNSASSPPDPGVSRMDILPKPPG